MTVSQSVSCNVPEGSNFGPLPFFIYINDGLPNCLIAASPRMFADDTNVSFAFLTLFKIKNVLNGKPKNNTESQ